MTNVLRSASEFESAVFPGQQALYERLAADGQHPQALIISCADSRVVPELITQAGPGELFVNRNVGNMVPPYPDAIGGVSSSIEYAVVALRVRDVVVMGHSDCGDMKGLLDPAALDRMPVVSTWLRHGHCACDVVRQTYPADLDPADRVAVLAQENVIAQLRNLRGHPSVAVALAEGRLTLHGWFFNLANGEIFALDGEAGHFRPLEQGRPMPVAMAGRKMPAAVVPRATEA